VKMARATRCLSRVESPRGTTSLLAYGIVMVVSAGYQRRHRR
jgi:hypothetical protein